MYFKISAPFFCRPLFVKEYLNPQVKIKKKGKLTVSITTLVLQDQPREYFLSYFYRLDRALALSRRFFKFSLKCSDCWKIHLRVKKTNLEIFTQAPQTIFSHRFLLSPQRGIFSFPQTAIFQKSVPPSRKRDTMNKQQVFFLLTRLFIRADTFNIWDIVQ